MLRHWLACASIIGTAGVPAAAFAQAQARHFDVSLQARIAHESNVALSDATQAALAGIKPSDTLYTPSITVDAYVPVSRQGFFLRGNVGYDLHQNNSQLDRTHADVTAGLNTEIGICRSTLSATYARAQADLQVLTLSDPRNIVDTQRGAFSTNCGRQTGLGATFSATAEHGNNSNRYQALTDSDSTSYTVGLNYRRPSLGNFQLYTSNGRVEYPDRVLTPGGSRGFETKAVGLSYERKVGSRLNAKVSAAQTSLKSLSPVAGSSGRYDGKTYSADITYRPTSKLALELHESRSINPALEAGRLYNIQDGLSAGLSYKIGTRLTFSATGSQSKIDPRGVLPVGGVILTRSQTTFGSASLAYRQSGRLSFSVDVGREERDTNVPRFNYSNDRVGLTTILGF